MSEKQLEQTESNTVVDHNGKFNTSVRFGTFAYDGKYNIVGINGRTLKVVDLSENNEPYFQAWVDGYQNDGDTHNEAVKNALNVANKQNTQSGSKDKSEVVKPKSNQG